MKTIYSLAFLALLTISTASVWASVGVPGGFKDSDKDDDLTKQAALEVVRQFNRESNSVYAHGLDEIVTAQHQVVAGIRYEMTINVRPTTCTKEENDGLPAVGTSCVWNVEEPMSRVRATVIYQAWSDPKYTVSIRAIEQV